MSAHPLPDSPADAYFAACYAAAPAFASRHFSFRGALRIHRRALGTDLLVAPANVLLALPAFLVRLASLCLRLTPWRRAARALERVPLSLPTKVGRHVESLVAEEVFAAGPGFPPYRPTPEAGGAFARRLHRYAAARSAVAEVTTALVAGVAGLLWFNEFSAGSLSTGRLLADAVGREAAAREFFAGDALGRLYYSMIAPDTPIAIIVGATLLVAVALSLCAAFAGVLSDPVQNVVGIHRRRLQRLVRSVEGVARADAAPKYAPKDHYLARATDLMDLLRSLWPW